MTELVILSGKGGTGKTSITASLAALAGQAVLADADVDAADLHLLLPPTIEQQHPFRAGHEAVIRTDDCIQCGACQSNCRFEAILTVNGGLPDERFEVDPFACEGCGVCVELCPVGAVDFRERTDGEWFVSQTAFGRMVHARLRPGGENSGKLVTRVRNEARQIATQQNAPWLIVDGPPGIGCPVIASVTGCDAALIVTEPTVAGAHDLDRILQLTRHFSVPSFVSVNKFDINLSMTEQIEHRAADAGARVLGRIPYDRSVTDAQINGQPVVLYGASPAATGIRQLKEELWNLAV